MSEERIMGQRAGIAWCLARLRMHADAMGDSDYRGVLRAAANDLAVYAKALRHEVIEPPKDTPA